MATATSKRELKIFLELTEEEAQYLLIFLQNGPEDESPKDFNQRQGLFDALKSHL